MAEPGALGTEWQNMKENVKDRLGHLRTSCDYSDLDIIFPNDKVTLKAHRLILAMSSSVFATMFKGSLAAGEVLNLPEDSPQGFQKLLDHMYLDRMDLESVKEALEVYAMAHKYRMDPARGVCLQYILSNLDEDAILEALETSIIYEDEALNKKCKKILNRDPDAVMSAEIVPSLSKENLRNLLRDDSLCFSSEVVTFKGLISWGRARIDNRKGDPSGSALREEIGDLLKEVRFLDMSCDEFVDHVVDTDVLTHTECIHILRAIRGADLSTIPETTPLNRTKVRRRPLLLRMEELSYFELRPVPYRGPTSIANREWRDQSLIEYFSSSSDIYVHYLKAPGSGNITIMNSRGETVSSANSKDGLFTFTTPAVLRKDKNYRIAFTSDIPCPLHPIPAGYKTIGNVDLSYSGAYNCDIHFSE